MVKENKFLLAVFECDYDLVLYYLEDKTCNVNFENKTALRLAIKENDYKMSQFLLSHPRIYNSLSIHWINNNLDNSESYKLKILYNLKQF